MVDLLLKNIDLQSSKTMCGSQLTTFDIYETSDKGVLIMGEKKKQSEGEIIRRERTPGEIVVARRKELGWTQEELSWRCGISTTTIGRVENDGTKASIGTIAKLEEVLGIPLLQIFTDYRKELDPEKKSYLSPTDALKHFERKLAQAGLSEEELNEVLGRALSAADCKENKS